jgi:hypothetical protein
MNVFYHRVIFIGNAIFMNVFYHRVIFIGNAVYKSYTPSYYLIFYFNFLFFYYNSLGTYQGMFSVSVY